ncbi:3-keto-steroid reductase [Saccharata proteae CBS 121410]|uniref:3-keto-steroid reductase n=1 Tax=Saccharata proteae CBS 121410 TaxID=1314787 RepID=A0A6A5YEZ6_9PEZI|nr:3-keto-steroid reductase [Saccharata proteae CBS 121410]
MSTSKKILNSLRILTILTQPRSGIGFAICCRLIDEFLHTRPQSQTLLLIPTTRSQRKCTDTASLLQKHLARATHNAEQQLPGIAALFARRVRIEPEILDLSSIVSVHDCAKRLRARIPKLDAMVFNAGIGGWTGINWPHAVYHIMTDWVNANTWPVGFKKATVGMVTRKQAPSSSQAAGGQDEEPALGEVFAANVFGHYLLGHYCAPLLQACSPHRGRMIWMSSLEAYASDFSLQDFQGLESLVPYEASKRLTDILALTYDMPGARPSSLPYFSLTERAADEGKAGDDDEAASPSWPGPHMYIAHPGIVITGIFPLPFPWLLTYVWMFAAYVARWLGSPWHPVRAYPGAVAPVWLALAEQATLDGAESQEGKGKWGSSTDRAGRERVARTEVEGWGFGGRVGDSVGKKGRAPKAKDLTEEEKGEFEKLGAVCWREMEGLRTGWVGRLKARGVDLED